MDSSAQYYEDNEHLKNYFLVILSIIAAFGLLMVFSSSYQHAKFHYSSSFYFFLKQAMYFTIAGAMAFVASKVKFSFWMKYGKYIHLMVAFVVFLTFIPGIGIIRNNASRWINLGFITFQPGELLKYTSIIFAANYFEDFNLLEVKDRVKGGLLLALPLAFLYKQPDYGMFTICFLVISFSCFLSSFSKKIFYSAFASGLVIGVALLFAQPYRVRRLLTFLDPWKDPSNSGFQITQSMMAMANGSWTGQGIGSSYGKLHYLPEAHNDFIFSIIGEEIGFLGITLLVALFLSLIYVGLRLALCVTDRKPFIVLTTVIFTIGLQVFLNMGVVLAILPTKGLNLPFISYGGSSLISNFFGIGLVFSALRWSKPVQSSFTRSQ